MLHIRVMATALAAAVVPFPAAAQTIRRAPAVVARPPVRGTVLPRGFRPVQRRFRPIKIGPHTFYGTIVGLNGNSVVVRTRKKQFVTVDATAVLAAGTYSAPLFVGKLVTVDGSQPATGPFVAAHISRLTNLNALRDDR